MSRIEGKVIETLSGSVLVLNLGTKHGVTEGMEFGIYDFGEEIIDPGTGEYLGRLEIHKGNVTVSHVQEKMCTARAGMHTEERTRIVDPFGMNIFRSFGPREVIDRVEVPNDIKIEVKEDKYTPKLTVRVGDWARSLT